MTDAERIMAIERASESLARELERFHKIVSSLEERIIVLEGWDDRA